MQTLLQHRSSAWARRAAGVVLAVASLSAVLVPATAQAQSEVSLAVSALPIASIAVVAGSAIAAHDKQPASAPVVSAQVAMSLTVMAIDTLASANIAFDDHPNAKRFADQSRRWTPSLPGWPRAAWAPRRLL
jgi:hypothetical protein